jgi:hypothetical protein
VIDPSPVDSKGALEETPATFLIWALGVGIALEAPTGDLGEDPEDGRKLRTANVPPDPPEGSRRSIDFKALVGDIHLGLSGWVTHILACEEPG